jgi:uncharacterized alpha-E superfamily protein
MFRGDGLSFMNLGRFLERAVQTATVLDVRFGELSLDTEKPTEAPYLKHLLMSLSGYALYLKRYRSGFEARNVVDQALFNNDFPRSILYSLNHVQRYFGRLKTDRNSPAYNKLDLMIGKVRSKVQYSDVETVAKVGLHLYLTELTGDISEIGVALDKHYFAN